MTDHSQQLGPKAAILDSRSEFGRSRILVRCPYCERELWVFKWSYAGCGKRCECGAKLGWLGSQPPKD